MLNFIKLLKKRRMDQLLIRQNLKDKVYLDIANNIAKLSKDEQTKIGCVIVGKDGSPVSWGYNGTIAGFDDEYIPHNREEKILKYYEGSNTVSFKSNKYPFMAHAEKNALHFAPDNKSEGATLYLTKPPCEDCALDIVKNKIARVVVENNTPTDKNSTIGNNEHIVKFLFSQAGIQYVINGEYVFLRKYYE